MGLHALGHIRQGLIAAGMAAATPAALVERGGTPARRILRGTLDELPARAAAWHAGGPVVLLIGIAVAAHETVSSLPEIAKQETLFAV